MIETVWNFEWKKLIIYKLQTFFFVFYLFSFEMESNFLQASQEGNVSTVKEILESCTININYKEYIWLQKLIIKFQTYFFYFISIFNHLWNWIPICNYTSLICASKEGHTQIVQLLLSQPGIEINCKDIWIQKSFIKFAFNLALGFNF